MKREQLARGIEHQLKGLTGKKKNQSQADILVNLSEKARADFFHSPLGNPFISFPIGSHRETWPVRSKRTRHWLTRQFYLATEKAPNNEAMQSALNVLEAKAIYEGNEERVHLRTAWHEDALYYDLCDEGWRSVKVTAKGWKVVRKCPVRFIRFGHMSAQVEPQREGNIDDLWRFVNVANDRDRRLLKSSVVTAFVPDIPRPPIVLNGDQGSGKTFTSKNLAALIDPSEAPLVRAKDEAELVQGLAHHYVVILDNLSSLSDWMSDLLSRAVTGEGFTKRKLYTDDEDIIFSYRRLLIITGIGLVVTKPDLLDRSLIICVERLPDNKRREERVLMEQFEAERPRLFGALLDHLVGAIREYSAVDLPSLPRMADYAKWAAAAIVGQGNSADQFTKDFADNIDRQNEEAIAASPTAAVLLALLDERKSWSGTSQELVSALKDQGDLMKIQSKQIPSTPSVLGRCLREIRPSLRTLGWEIDFGKGHHPRTMTISKIDIVESRIGMENSVPNVPPVPLAEKPTSYEGQQQPQGSDGTDRVPLAVPHTNSPNSLKLNQNLGDRDSRDGRDSILGTSSGDESVSEEGWEDVSNGPS